MAGNEEAGASGRIGDLVSVQTMFSYFNRHADKIRNKKETGGGALYDIGCYAVNTSRYLFGREPIRAIVLVERDPDFGTDRLTSGMLDYGGAHLTFTCSTQAVPYQRVNVLGTRGRIEIEVPFNAPADQPCRILVDDGLHHERQFGRVNLISPRGSVSSAERGVFARRFSKTGFANPLSPLLLAWVGNCGIVQWEFFTTKKLVIKRRVPHGTEDDA